MPTKLTPTLHCTAMHIPPVSLLLLSHVKLTVGPHQQHTHLTSFAVYMCFCRVGFIILFLLCTISQCPFVYLG